MTSSVPGDASRSSPASAADLSHAAVPVVSAVKVLKALERGGFAIARINGSHHIMRHSDGRTVSVPVHGGQDVPKGTLRSILTTIGMSPDEFRKLI
jgi:predicted RNA binding protein YcfA (HicA-like mRNA interferase family)